ncbi:MAG: MFS transporter [Proteobacteria bacterium]|nr:MFS transporter [Pseudomonadota bacterium]
MSETKQFKVSRGYAHYVFFLLFLMYAFDYIDRQVIASLFPYLKADWGLSDTQCGWLASIVTLTMTLFVFPVSLLIDRWSRKKAIGIMAILWSIAAGACALTRNFSQLFALRSVIGIGEAAYTAGGHAMIAAYYPEEKRATMNGLFTAAVPLGTAAGVVIGGVIAVNLGWRYAFGLTAIPGLFVALLFFRIKDYKTVKVLKKATSGTQDAATRKNFTEIIKEFARTPSLIFTYLGYVGNTFVTTAFMTWLPTYFHRTDGLAMDKAGMKSSVVFLLAILGAPLGGMLADRWRKNQLNARMLLPAITSFLSAILIFIGFTFFTGTVQYLFLLMFGFFAPMFAAAGSAVTQDVVHPGLRAVSYSMCQFFMMALGYSMSPIVVGFISDRYDLITAFRIMPIFALFGSLVFFIGSFYYVSDLNKVEKVVLEAE